MMNEELVLQLVGMPRRQYSELIRKVDAARRRVVESEGGEDFPPAAAGRDEFARWMARCHFEVDKGISRIVYFPEGAPPREVRLLEVNDLAHLPENAPVEPFEFAAVAGYSLFVADVTPGQFEALKAGSLTLPDGWVWENAQDLTPAA